MTTKITDPAGAAKASHDYPALLKDALESTSSAFASYTAEDQRILYRSLINRETIPAGAADQAYRLEAIQTLLEILERSNMEIILSAISVADKAHFHEQIDALHEKRQARACLD